MTYTVKELIETLKQCPQDCEIEIYNFANTNVENLDAVGIYNNKVTFYLNQDERN